MTTPSLSHAILGSQVARRLLGVLAPSVGLLAILAIAAWTTLDFFSCGVVILAAAVFASWIRR